MNNKIKFYQTAIEVYKKGENVVQTLLKEGANKSESIEIAYELQAGSYTSAFHKSSFYATRNKALHTIIEKYCDLPEVSSVGVFGVGEAVNWIGFKGQINDFYGVELSYSRLRYARSNLSEVVGIKQNTLIKGDASETVFKPSSFDLTITLHSIEPNGDVQGEKMLRNVINSSSKYVLLFEPDYSTAPKSMRERMKSNGYVCNIEQVIEELQTVSVIDKFLLEIQANNDNLTTCWILEKNQIELSVDNKLVCPYSNDPLIDLADEKYSPEVGLVYPTIDGIMFINKGDAVFVGAQDLNS
jgi:hypothetical protein